MNNATFAYRVQIEWVRRVREGELFAWFCSLFPSPVLVIFKCKIMKSKSGEEKIILQFNKAHTLLANTDQQQQQMVNFCKWQKMQKLFWSGSSFYLAFLFKFKFVQVENIHTLTYVHTLTLGQVQNNKCRKWNKRKNSVKWL